MFAKRILSVFVLMAVFFVYTTYDLQAAAIETPTLSHAVSTQELHQAVQASDQKANEARKAVQDFLTRSDVVAQISRVGLNPGEVAARVQMLNDADVMFLQQQIMKEDLQSATAAGLTKGGKIMTVIGVVLLAAGLIAVATHWDYEFWEGSGDEGWSIAWKGTGVLWCIAGGVLTAIGLTRRN
jgi:hypothetical protein